MQSNALPARQEYNTTYPSPPQTQLTEFTFGPSQNVEEGERITRDLKAFIEDSARSEESRASVQSMSIHWGPGMPASSFWIPHIFQVFHKVATLRLFSSLTTGSVIASLPGTRFDVDHLELGHNAMNAPSHEFLLEHLIYFSRIGELVLERLEPFGNDVKHIARPGHLTVNSLDVRDCDINILTVVKRMLARNPCSLEKFRFGQISPCNHKRAAAFVNRFLGDYGESLKELTFFVCPAQTPYRAGETHPILTTFKPRAYSSISIR